ncbi:putative Polycomb group protein ASXL3 [Aix galericulata]|nr:putative Polycomb group protein ASXL3 [Aix galericulata]
MSWDRMRYILWDNNCSVPPQIHMTPFTAAFAERSPYLLRKEKEREGESERAEKRRAPTAQISNLPPPPPPPPPNTQQQPPPQIRCAPKTPPRLQTTALPATHARRGSEKARGREGLDLFANRRKKKIQEREGFGAAPRSRISDVF